MDVYAWIILNPREEKSNAPCIKQKFQVFYQFSKKKEV